MADAYEREYVAGARSFSRLEVTQSWLGRSALNCRRTLSLSDAVAGSPKVGRPGVGRPLAI